MFKMCNGYIYTCFQLPINYNGCISLLQLAICSLNDKNDYEESYTESNSRCSDSK